jgi:alanine dehydrogenase
MEGKAKGRTSPEQITYSERGNVQGVQFFAVAAKVYEAAKRAGRGRKIPTEWLLQDIRN